jgi:hypothetical protein
MMQPCWKTCALRRQNIQEDRQVSLLALFPGAVSIPHELFFGISTKGAISLATLARF